MWSSLGPTSLGLSKLPGLPGNLFPLPDWGSSSSLFFQISFQVLVLPILLALTIWLLGHLKLSQPFPRLSSFFEFFLLYSILFGYLFLPFVPNHWFESWFPSFQLVPYIFCFISLWVAFISFSFCDWAQSVLWASRLPVFWILHVIGWTSPHHLALFLEFWSVLSFGPYFFLSVHQLCCKGAGP